MIKKIVSAILAIALSCTIVSCGSSSKKDDNPLNNQKALDEVNEMSPEERDEYFNQQMEALESLSPEEQKDFMEKKLNGENATVSDNKTEESEPQTKDVYEPTQEIMDADFTSGLIQIGDSVFKCGGYLTVNDFISQYGDKWDCSEIKADSPLKDYTGNNFLVLKNKNDSRLCLRVWFVGFEKYDFETVAQETQSELDEYKELVKDKDESDYSDYDIRYIKNLEGIINRCPREVNKYNSIKKDAKLGDAIIYNVVPEDKKTENQTFYPKGINLNLEESTEETALQFLSDNFGASTKNIEISDWFSGIGYDAGQSAVKELYMDKVSYEDNVTIKDNDSGYFLNTERDNIIYYGTGYVHSIQLKDTNLLNQTPYIFYMYLLSSKEKEQNKLYTVEMVLSEDPIIAYSCNGLREF